MMSGSDNAIIAVAVGGYWLLNVAACVVTQLVPSDTMVAQLPATLSSMAVPAAPPDLDTTLLDADTNN